MAKSLLTTLTHHARKMSQNLLSQPPVHPLTKQAGCCPWCKVSVTSSLKWCFFSIKLHKKKLFDFELHWKSGREHRARRTLILWIEINKDENFLRLEVEGSRTGLASSKSWKKSLQLWCSHSKSISWPTRIFPQGILQESEILEEVENGIRR